MTPAEYYGPSAIGWVVAIGINLWPLWFSIVILAVLAYSVKALEID